jgi:hypothetical protein
MQEAPIVQGPVDVNVRPLVPLGEPWVRHGYGIDEWWGLLGYTCVKKRGLWVLSYRGDTLGAYEYLSEAMRSAEGPNG